MFNHGQTTLKYEYAVHVCSSQGFSMFGYYQKNLENYILSSSRRNLLQTKLCYLHTHPHLATGFPEDFNGPLFWIVIRYD